MGLGKEEQTKLRISRREEIIKFRVETNEIENRKTIEKTNKIKDRFFKKINKNFIMFFYELF